ISPMAFSGLVCVLGQQSVVTVLTDKTHLLAFGTEVAWQARETGHRPATVDYLGFTHYWGRSRNGLVRVKRKTSKHRLRRALRDLTQWLRQERPARKL